MSNSILNYFIAGSLGILFQIFVIKIPSLKSKSRAANHPFSMKEYLQDDWITILGSFLSIGIMIYGLDEVLNFKPELEKYVKWLFIFVGFTGSSIIQAVFSVANKKVMQIIDVKTNIADGVEPPINAENAEGAKEIIKDETRVVDINKP